MPMETQELVGTRPPDGLVWSSDRDEFFFGVGDQPDDEQHVYSRSMILEGAKSGVIQESTALQFLRTLTPDTEPVKIRPWSILRLTDGDASVEMQCGTDSEVKCKVDDILSKLQAKGIQMDSDDKAELTWYLRSSVQSDKDIPSLEEPIPEQHMPDIILVKDPHTLLKASADASAPAWGAERRFRLVRWDGQSGQDRIAHLELPSTAELGRGSHATVYTGLFRPPSPLSIASRTGEAKIAVKITDDNERDWDMLMQEGRAYATMPQYLSETWSGFHYLPESTHQGDGKVPINAVVPQYYGTYVLDEGRGDNDKGVQVGADMERYASGMPAFSLFEDCGKAFCKDVYTVTPSQRSEIFSMGVRLHRAGIIHNSFHERNILVKPGPLHKRPAERSNYTPSCRVVDFGRAQFRGDGEMSDSEWSSVCAEEMSTMKEAVREVDYGYLLRRLNRLDDNGLSREWD